VHCKINEEAYKEPLGEIQFEKMTEKQNERGARSL
jgi:hypothetical protein